MISYHTPSVRRAALRTIAIATALVLPITIAPAAHAQLNDSFRASTRGLKLTPQELSDLELTQIAPDFRLHREWASCVNQTAALVLANDRGVQEAASFAFDGCESGQGLLQASLARIIGLARARRAMATLRENKLFEIKLLHQRMHAPRPGVIAMIGSWSIKRTADSCVATYTTQGPLAPQTALVQRAANGFSLILHNDGSAARATAAVEPFTDIIILWKQSNSTQYGQQLFTPVTVQSGAAVRTPLGPTLLAALAANDRFQRGSDNTFPIDGIVAVTAALDRCFLGK